MARAVIFDHDGVILDNQCAQRKAWKQILAEKGIIITDEDYAKRIRGVPNFTTLKTFLGNKFDDEKIRRISKRKDEIYREIFSKSFKLVDGLIPFLKNLKRAKIPIAIATSSTPEMLDFTFNHAEIKKYFDILVTFNDITKGKPHPQIYQITCKKLGFKPHKCVVFEDSISGIESAKRAGTKVVLVMTSHEKGKIKKIDFAIKDFTEIKIADILKL